MVTKQLRKAGDAPTSAPTSAPGLPALILPSELASYLGVQERTLSAWRQQGRGPRYIALGGRGVRYRRSAVERWLESQERESTREGEGKG